MNKKEFTLSQKILITILLALGIMLPLLKIYLNQINSTNTKNKSIYTYQIKQNTNYTVNLFENNFTNTTEMPADKVYVSDLVKNIKLNFLYNYSASNKANLNYTYYVKGRLYGEKVNNETSAKEIVWEKEYPLTDTINKELTNTSNISINQPVTIDFPKFKEEVYNFKKQFGLTLNNNLELIMYVDITGTYNNKNISKKSKIKLDIPLGEQAFSIKKDYKPTINDSLHEDKIKLGNHNKIYLLISILSLIIFLSLFKKLFDIKPKTTYQKSLSKILHSYGQVIVEVETKVDEAKKKVIKVKNFDEMLDLEEELRIPIILYEKNNEATFTITKDNDIYKYILK